MKTFYNVATLILMVTVLAVSAFAQEPGPETALVNLTEGQGAIASTGAQAWDGRGIGDSDQGRRAARRARAGGDHRAALASG